MIGRKLLAGISLHSGTPWVLPSETEDAKFFMLRYPPTFIRNPQASIRLSYDAFESVLVPLDRFGLVHTVGGADLALGPPTLGNALTGSGHADVEVHSVDTVSSQPTASLNLDVA